MWRSIGGFAAVLSLVVISLVPSAAAEQASLNLSAALPYAASGTMQVASHDPTILLQTVHGNAHWKVEGAILNLVHVERWTEVSSSEMTGATPQSGVRTQRHTVTDGTITVLDRLPGFTGLAWSDSPASTAVVGDPPATSQEALHPDLRLFRLSAPLTIWAPGDDTNVVETTVLGRPVPFQYDIPTGDLQAQTADATHRLSGTIAGYLHGASVSVDHADGTLHWTLDERVEQRRGKAYVPGEGWVGPGSHKERIQHYVQFETAQGVFTLHTQGATTAVFGHTMDANLDGQLTLPAATGTVTFADGEVHHFDTTQLTVGGKSEVTIQPADQTERATLSGQGDVAYVKLAGGTEVFTTATVAATAAGVAAFAALGVAVWKLGSGAGLTLFSRVAKSNALDHKTRAELYAFVKAQPGATPNDMVTAVGVGWSTVMYHLGVLESNQLVIAMKDGRYRRFFDRESGRFSNGRKHVVSALKNETTAAIAQLVRDAPGQVQRRLAERFGLAASSVHWHVSRLAEVDLVEKRRVGQRVELHPGPAWAVIDEELGSCLDLSATLAPPPEASSDVDATSQSGAIQSQG